LTDNACYVLPHILDPRWLSDLESHDVAIMICQSLGGGYTALIQATLAGHLSTMFTLVESGARVVGWCRLTESCIRI